MGTTSPLSADDDLFAAKGRATPLEQTRPKETREETTAADAPTPPPISHDLGTAALPGFFAEGPDDATPDSDHWAEDGTAETEPPPAASLLSIAAQGSAARSRLGARTPSPPDNDTGGENVQGDAAITEPGKTHDADPGANDELHANTAVRLPVPIRINLPSVIAPIAEPRPSQRKKAALLAACIAVIAAGSTVMFVTKPEPPPDFKPTSERQLANADSVPDGAAEPASETPTGPVETTTEIHPKTEIASVRFGNAGRAVIHGRAAPGSELIVLRNRRPLGTVRADNSGQWTLTTRVPARIEQHEISVAPLQIDTTVTVDKPAFVPRPQRRPALPPPTAASYFVQIASLPSAVEARREAEKLTSKLSGTVSADKISVRAATIEQGRTVYRVAINGFSTKAKAETACIRIRTRKAPCLVMRDP